MTKYILLILLLAGCSTIPKFIDHNTSFTDYSDRELDAYFQGQKDYCVAPEVIVCLKESDSDEHLDSCVDAHRVICDDPINKAKEELKLRLDIDRFNEKQTDRLD